MILSLLLFVQSNEKLFGLDIQIIAVLITIGGSFLLFAVTKLYESQQSIKKDLRDAKKPTYQKLIRTIIRIQVADKLEKPISSNKVSEEIVDLFRDMIIWGSDNLLKKFIAFVVMTMNSHESNAALSKLIYDLDDILRDIREEMGHENENLKAGEIMGIFLKDIDQYIEINHGK